MIYSEGATWYISLTSGEANSGWLCLHEQPPVKTRATKAQGSLPSTSCMLSHTIAGRVKSRTPLGEDNWELASALSWTLLYMSFSFADFHLYPFTVINYNRECNGFAEFCVYF